MGAHSRDGAAMRLDPRTVARALGGTASGRRVMAPGPGHSRADRSLSIILEPTAPDGFGCHSFADDDWRVCRDYVRRALGLGAWEPRRSAPRRQPRAVARGDDGAGERIAAALRIWREARDPRGTLAEHYLMTSRNKLLLGDDVAGDVIRYHPRLWFAGGYVGGMVALHRDIHTDEPCGIHRTFLDAAGRKLDRKMLGRARGAAVKLDTDASVSLGLHIGEGIETCLAARLFGFRPVWALGSAGNTTGRITTGIAAFPVLSGIEVLSILGETDDRGTNARAAQACAERWERAGREAYWIDPQTFGDMNDVWREVTP
jgi:putative DNA primase/helicase